MNTQSLWITLNAQIFLQIKEPFLAYWAQANLIAQTAPETDTNCTKHRWAPSWGGVMFHLTGQTLWQWEKGEATKQELELMTLYADERGA